MNLRYTAVLSFLLCCSLALNAQHVSDTLLFSIELNEDSSSIYGCRWDDRVRSVLAGPVIMADKQLLFYSQFGYVLYNQRGKLMDSHSLFKVNRGAARSGKPQIRLAYPLDSTTILYYRESAQPGAPPEVFQKKLSRGGLSQVDISGGYEFYKRINSTHLFNLASNSITDEMGIKSYLIDNLVGYTSLEGGKRWWTPDRFYTFTSPLVMEEKGRCVSFFTGLRADQPCEVKVHLIEPLGVYFLDGHWYYYGLYTERGNKEDAYKQVLLLCDEAGNLLYSNDLLKEEITDAVLQKVESTNTLYTVRRAARHAFVPAVDRTGGIYYGVIDFEKKRIEVYKRLFFRFTTSDAKPGYPDLFAAESTLTSTLAELPCNEATREGVLSGFARLTSKGTAAIKNTDLLVSGYYVKLHRTPDPELRKKISRSHPAIPQNVRRMLDSIAQLETTPCSYDVSIGTEGTGKLNLIHYGVGEVVRSARILAVTRSYEVFVRVDLENWAEVLTFGTDGKFMNRFTFNTQPYRDRRDLVVVSKDRIVLERDYERKKKAPRYLSWNLGVTRIQLPR